MKLSQRQRWWGIAIGVCVLGAVLGVLEYTLGLTRETRVGIALVGIVGLVVAFWPFGSGDG